MSAQGPGRDHGAARAGQARGTAIIAAQAGAPELAASSLKAAWTGPGLGRPGRGDVALAEVLGAGGATVLDRVVSSYTPTIRALAYARRQARSPAPARSLIVAMPVTPGADPLPGATAEAEALAARLPQPTLLLSSSPHATTPTKAAVLAHLPAAEIAHFACHAVIDPASPPSRR